MNATTSAAARNAKRVAGFDLAMAVVVALGFCWRLWLAHATFFNTDEAWHYFLANQESARLAYKASLTIGHPPLLILILYFCRALGTSNLVLRLPSVIAGTAFCWFLARWLEATTSRAAAWAGLILAAFLGPMITISAEVRQYPLLLMFSAAAVYWFDRAISENSVVPMAASSASLCLAMFSHYSAFFVAGALGVYAIVRMIGQRPSWPVLSTWCAGQVLGVACAGWLYKTHLSKLSILLNQGLQPQQYLAYSYFHRGQDQFAPFFYRGTFGVFRFIFGQTQIGQLAALLFVAGVVILVMGNAASADAPDAQRAPRALGMLLILPFILNWTATAAGLYPYGRMRHCIFLAFFVLAGVSVCLARIAGGRLFPAAALALGIVVLCHLFGTLQDRDQLPLAEQRAEHMDAALQFIRTQIQSNDVILTDYATRYQLRHYLCRQQPVGIELMPDGYEAFRCEGLQVMTNPKAGALTAEEVAALPSDPHGPLSTARQIWIVQGGWASGLGETLRRSAPAFSSLEVHSFGRYLEIFQMPPTSPGVIVQPQPR